MKCLINGIRKITTHYTADSSPLLLMISNQQEIRINLLLHRQDIHGQHQRQQCGIQVSHISKRLHKMVKGYCQHLQRDGTPIQRTANTPTTAETGYKDQNSSIHLLEAFTELYAVWPNDLLRERLHEMLFLIRDVMIGNKGYLTLFFQPDWTPVSIRDSSDAYIMMRHGLDYVSFGHNVETSYLLLEASHTLSIKNDTTTLRIAKQMVDHALQYARDDEHGGFYDAGFYFKDKPGLTIISKEKNWWSQAEAMNSLLMM